jgi:hypothetical protein
MLQRPNNVIQAFTNTGSLERNLASNTVELYDIIPKYARAGHEQAIVSNPDESRRTYTITYKKRTYRIQIDAAKIKNKLGKFEYVYPSTQEEIVEDVIRYLSVSQDIGFLRDNYGCRCSLYLIKAELKKRGKTRSTAEVKRSIEILGKSELTIYIEPTQHKEPPVQIFTGTFFSESTIMNFSQWTQSKKSRCNDTFTTKIKFHNMVTDRILEGDFRLVRYDICMNYKHPMARWLHKRISHCHKGADSKTPFMINLSTIFNDGNWCWTNRIRTNKKTLLKALEEMVNLDQIQKPNDSDFRKIYDSTGRHIDYHCTIRPSKTLISHIILANSVAKENMSIISNNESYITDDEQLLINNGVSLKVAKRLAANHCRDSINSAIAYSNRAREKSNSKDFSVGAYINKCLEEGWHKTINVQQKEYDTSEIEIDPHSLGRLSDDLQKKVTSMWSGWTKGTKKTFNKHGLKSPHIVSRLGLE